MLRLKPIRRSRRRRTSRGAVLLAEMALCVGLVVAVFIGGRILALPGSSDFGDPHAAVSGRAMVRTTAGPQQWLRGSQWDGENVPSSSRPEIAIVIDDLGADVSHTRRAIALPSQIALSFLPYPDTTPTLARDAVRAGHEVLAHVPMQAVGPQDPGPMVLRTDQSGAEIARRLDWSLSRVPGFIGINNHEGSKFTADGTALLAVIENLAGRHVFFFDSRTTPDSQVVALSRAHGVASAARDVFLDDVPTVDAVDEQMRALESRARSNGVAIAIGHPHETTLAALAQWTARENGFALVTLSHAIAAKTEARPRPSLSLSSR